MKIFAYEHITGGGMIDAPLPAALAREGALMAHALVGDLRDVPQVEVTTMIDARLDPHVVAHDPRAASNLITHEVNERGEWESTMRALLDDCDSFWPVAPETDGMLESLSARAVKRGKRLLNSSPNAVRVAGSKYATANALGARGVDVIATYRFDAPIDSVEPCAWVVKPDDGCGCTDVRRFADRAVARTWIATQPTPARFVVQPYVAGATLSVCALARDATGYVLAVNRQHLRVIDGQFTLEALDTHAYADLDGRIGALVRAIVRAIPGLWGCFGVDLIANEHGLFVVEVNPRWTTSFAALRAATGLNAAQLAIDAVNGVAPPEEGTLSVNPVRITLSDPVAEHACTTQVSA